MTPTAINPVVEVPLDDLTTLIQAFHQLEDHPRPARTGPVCRCGWGYEFDIDGRWVEQHRLHVEHHLHLARHGIITTGGGR